MTRTTFVLTLALPLAALSSAARADLSSPLYVQGKAAYDVGQWTDAYTKLRDYEIVDAAFLSKNPDIKNKVDEAIADAHEKSMTKIVQATGSAIGVTQQQSVTRAAGSAAPPRASATSAQGLGAH